jgi:hypothetical protein
LALNAVEVVASETSYNACKGKLHKQSINNMAESKMVAVTNLANAQQHADQVICKVNHLDDF